MVDLTTHLRLLGDKCVIAITSAPHTRPEADAQPAEPALPTSSEEAAASSAWR